MSVRAVRLALATSSALPLLDEDDRLLARALEDRGACVEPVVWDDPGVAWDGFDRCVIRSTWDYTDRPEAFCAWADRVGPRLLNPPSVVRWNAHKGYLGALARAGVHVVPTAFVAAAEPLDLARLAEARGWEEVVVKPCVSAGARHTYRVDPRRGQAEAEAVRARGDLMVQPYQPEVERGGERSLIFLGGAFSHAIRKHPSLPTAGAASSAALAAAGAPSSTRPPEPRVDAAPDELALAREAIARSPGPLAYARVDVVRGDDGRPRLMELELIEPRLFFFADAAAADRLAAALLS